MIIKSSYISPSINWTIIKFVWLDEWRTPRIDRPAARSQHGGINVYERSQNNELRNIVHFISTIFQLESKLHPSGDRIEREFYTSNNSRKSSEMTAEQGNGTDAQTDGIDEADITNTGHRDSTTDVTTTDTRIVFLDPRQRLVSTELWHRMWRMELILLHQPSWH